jgi:hypothetical protein
VQKEQPIKHADKAFVLMVFFVASASFLIYYLALNLGANSAVSVF